MFSTAILQLASQGWMGGCPVAAFLNSFGILKLYIAAPKEWRAKFLNSTSLYFLLGRQVPHPTYPFVPCRQASSLPVALDVSYEEEHA